MSHLRKSDYSVRLIDFQIGRMFVIERHYSKGGSNTRTFMHGLFDKEDNLCGVAWWIPPTRTCAESNFQGDFRKVLMLTRLVIADNVPTNGASYLLGRSIRLIRQDGRFLCLLTYADTWQGHTGAIYKATNWEYLGLTRPERTFVDSAGRMVSRKAGPRSRTTAEMIALGCKQIGAYAKHRFRLVL